MDVIRVAHRRRTGMNYANDDRNANTAGRHRTGGETIDHDDGPRRHADADPRDGDQAPGERTGRKRRR
jgi:hypothetical protein